MWRFFFFVLLPVVLFGEPYIRDQDAESQPLGRPNLLLVVTDDQRFDQMEGLPFTRSTILGEGIIFQRAYITTPLCCPSRASLLTGKYASSHRVLGNNFALRLPTVVRTLKEAGYRTGLVGKYMNSVDGTPLPEFDFWVSFHGGGASYTDPLLNVQGVWARKSGYITDILAEYADQFLKQSQSDNRPFLLLFTPTAPHAPAVPAARHLGAFANLNVLSPIANRAAEPLQPHWLRKRNPYSDKALTTIREFAIRQNETLLAVDEAVSGMCSTLKRADKLDNTAVFFMSDNGILHAEHRLRSKGNVYEESVHVPFGLRYPPLVPAPQVSSALVANIDIAPTLLDLAQLPADPSMDGRSLVEAIRSPETWRKELLLESWSLKKSSRGFVALHTGDLVFVKNQRDVPELYDLRVDPAQLRNLANDPAYAAERSRLETALDALVIAKRGSLSFFQPKGVLSLIGIRNRGKRERIRENGNPRLVAKATRTARALRAGPYSNRQ